MADTGSVWWTQVDGPKLLQGDFLPRCLVPFTSPDYGATGETQDVPVKEYDCIVLTQSCDLEHGKAPLVALCPLYPITKFEQVNTRFAEKGTWEKVRLGRIEGLHLVASMDDPEENRACFVANFREIYSLPIGYLQEHAERLGPRWRLQSPFLEHFSQAFARFFMRVGLPSAIPSFK